MLRRIRISHFAILPEAQLEFSNGLNVLTGETGAGKSILVDAVGLLAGRRATSDDVRSGEKQAVVEGDLELDPDCPIWRALDEAGVPYDDYELVIRRTVSADGRSKVYVNGYQWTVSGLADLAKYWIDISGQHGQQELLDETHHLELLDSFGHYAEEAEQYHQSFHRCAKTKAELDELKKQREEAEKQREYISFQLAELNKAELKKDELEELTSLHSRLKHGERLAESVSRIRELSDSDDAAIDLLGRISAELEAVSALDQTAEKWMEEIGVVSEKLGEVSRWATDYLDRMEFDPAEVDRINTRFAQLQAIIRKYGSIEEALEEQNRFREMLSLLETSNDRENELEDRFQFESKEALKCAKKLTQKRKSASAEFAKMISSELGHLGMPSAELRVEFSSLTKETAAFESDGVFLNRDGAESVSFQIAPNPGEGFKSLSKIASGGELSRILLAIKGIAIKGQNAARVTFLFDEVDTGIGGETAERVGIRMASLAHGRQVLCVTHLAQIASYADMHAVVSKEIQKNRTVALLSPVESDDRENELARMIGGIEKTQKTKDHARELLTRARESKEKVRHADRVSGKHPSRNKKVKRHVVAV